MTRRRVAFASLIAALALAVSHAARAEEPAASSFFRGLNLNGPPVEIDGQAWEGADSPRYATDDRAFENQDVPLRPTTDDARALMIRSSRWNHEARITLTEVPTGRYSVFLYVWEDNDPEIFSVMLQGRVVAADFRSGNAGEWQRLGPFVVDVGEEAAIVLTSRGGAANFSGIEVWTGEVPIPAAGEPVDPLPPISDEAAVRGVELIGKRPHDRLAVEPDFLDAAMEVVVQEFRDAAVTVGLFDQIIGGVIGEVTGVLQFVRFLNDAVQVVEHPDRGVADGIGQARSISDRIMRERGRRRFERARPIRVGLRDGERAVEVVECVDRDVAEWVGFFDEVSDSIE